jgi:CRP-like cAMP-binding protein
VAIENLERELAEHPFFKGLSTSHFATLAGCVSNARFETGDFLLREGAPADRFYALRHGRVCVESFIPGRGAAAIETVAEGDIVGWSWLFPPHKSHFDARALTLVRAIALDGTCLRAKCEEDPSFGNEILKRFAQVVVHRLEAARLHLLDLYGNAS